jgi:hypothetical protein
MSKRVEVLVFMEFVGSPGVKNNFLIVNIFLFTLKEKELVNEGLALGQGME